MKIAKEYGYITEIQTEIMRWRMADRQSILRRREMLPNDPRRISRTLAPSSPPPTAELVRRHHTRMSKRLASRQAAHLVPTYALSGLGKRSLIRQTTQLGMTRRTLWPRRPCSIDLVPLPSSCAKISAQYCRLICNTIGSRQTISMSC